MAIVPTAAALRNENSAVRLARYAQRIEYDECAFFGVDAPDNAVVMCRDIWSKRQRDNIAFYLGEAQREIEDQLRYFLSPKWVVGKLDDEPSGDLRYVDDQPFGCAGQTKWGAVIEGGIRATATVQAAAAVNQGTDPGVVTINPVAFTDVNEVVVYHPGTTIEIDPSAVTIAANILTISLPRCRTVKPEFADNSEQGVDYATLTNFESTVDVVRVYNDPSTNAVLAHKNRCKNPACAETTHTACLYFRDRYIGTYELSVASYNEETDAWQRACLSWCCNFPKLSRLYYRAGMQVLDEQLEDAVIRLAHSKMPAPPCGCEDIRRMWEDDRNIPTSLTRERVNCPFGLNDGAWIAWNFVKARKIFKMLVM